MKLRAGPFVIVLAVAVLAGPLTFQAQPAGTLPKIGILGTPPPEDSTYQALLQGLNDLGYADGKNVLIEFRWGDPRRFPDFAGELVRLNVAVIATFGTPAAMAAKQATTTVPIVMALVGDPLRSGLVASLARPGGNITGVTNLAPGMVTKRLELLKEAVPNASRVAFLWNPANQDQFAHFNEAEAAAPSLGVTLQSIAVRSGEELEHALAAMMRERPSALVMTGDTVLQRHIDRILTFAAKNRLPVVLPLEQPTKFDLVINLKTAKALDLRIPSSLLLRTDRVIE